MFLHFIIFGGCRMGGAGVGTSSPNGGCSDSAPPYGSVGALAGAYLGGAGGDALTSLIFPHPMR
jgi:hypothetical protein